jgi:hypothetical protein
MFETFATIVQVVFAGLLVWATYLLATHTRTLARLTKELVGIEERREQRIAHEDRLGRIQSAFMLAEKILELNYGDFGAFLYPRLHKATPNQHQLIKDMDLLRGCFHDAEAMNYLDKLVKAIRLVEEGSALDENDRKQAMEVFKRFQTKLKTCEMDTWRDELALRADATKAAK